MKLNLPNRGTRFGSFYFVTKNLPQNILKTKGMVVKMFKKRKCCGRNNFKSVGLFFIAIGVGLFLAYAIPRYLLITLLGLVLIGTGACLVVKK